MFIKKTIYVLGVFFLLMTQSMLAQQDYYVSANLGSGRKGTKEAPVKNIGNLLKKLKAGDTIHIAQGVYQGKSKAGFVELNVPVNIVGGYDDTFTKRDPWGGHKTILSGDNKSKNGANAARLGVFLKSFNREKRMEFLHAKEVKVYEILIDGIIIDNAGRNRYASDLQKRIVRKANPSTNERPTPDRAGILVEAPFHGNVTIQNCIVMNCAPTEGALSVFGSQGARIVIHNNLVINNTGVGIFAGTGWRPRDGRDLVQYSITHNTVLFTEKYDSFGSINGHAFKLDSDTNIQAQWNVFGFSDQAGLMSGTRSEYKRLTLAHNLFYGNLGADMIEFDLELNVDEFDDDSEELSEDSEGNVGDGIQVNVPETWASLYMSRVLINRNAKEAGVSAVDAKMNDLRKMLGLPQQADDMTLDSDVWLPRLTVESAIQGGNAPYNEKYGCKKP